MLCAATFTQTFKAGASYYGISDLEAMTLDTHKFESRYLENLVGPYPKRRDLYRSRSAIHHTDKLSCPLIFLQGLEDKIVPPNQTVMMMEALKKKVFQSPALCSRANNMASVAQRLFVEVWKVSCISTLASSASICRRTSRRLRFRICPDCDQLPILL